MMKFRTILSLFLIVAASLAASMLTEQHAAAQQTGFETAEEALLAALTEYRQATGSTEDWELGTVLTMGKYGYSVASTAQSVDSTQDFVLLLTQQLDGGLWFFAAPEVVPEEEYNRWLDAAPSALIDDFSKAFYYQYTPEDFALFNRLRSISLYKFPWPIRREAVLTQKHGTYHYNQLDFVVRNTSDIYASKPGLVVYVKEVSDIGGCDINLWPWANMVVVMHSLTEYSWYVHLKQNSVPVEVGDLIGYGTKIGEQGYTGFSCGSTGIHLHYMVSDDAPTNWPDPNVPNYAPWPPGGSIIPVDFMEISFAALTVGTYYESTNAPPPGICSTTATALNIYDNTYCNSSLRSFAGTGLHQLDVLEMAERIESMEVPQGWSVGLYREENELGPRVCLSQSDPMLWDNQFDNGEVVANRTVWMRIYNTAGCPYPFEQGIAFYPEANFVGTPTFGMIGERIANGPNSTIGSIYLPGGYSTRLFDQDDGTGNSICLSSSVLDMSTLDKWSSTVIESVELIQGDACAPEPVPIPQPALTYPENNGIAYTEYTELCWHVGDYPGELSFNVEITNPEGTFNDTSGWITGSCWVPASLVGQMGEFSWRVQAKNSEGTLSKWSETFNFTIAVDEIAPLASFRFLEDGSQLPWPRANILVNAADGETRVARVHYFAWYDDGAGAGYDWHYIGADEDETDDWNILWNGVDVGQQDVALWIYAEDMGGNFASDFISGLHISESQTGDGGIEGRDGGDPRDLAEGEGPPPVTEEESPVTPPASQPSGSSPGTANNSEQPATNTPVSTAPAAPQLSSPVGDRTYYRPDEIVLCWQEPTDSPSMRYRVELSGAENLISPWVSSICWQPPADAIGFGSYSWRVQSRSSSGATSQWSQKSTFGLAEDLTAPSVVLNVDTISREHNSAIDLIVHSEDPESGLYKLYLLAWFDSGDGYQWHDLTEIVASADSEYSYTWDISEIPKQSVQIWVYALDNVGNAGAARVEGIQLDGEGSPGQPAQKKGLPDTIGRFGDH